MSCFVNNYFDEGLLAWEANIDLQHLQYLIITKQFTTCVPIFQRLKACALMQ